MLKISKPLSAGKVSTYFEESYTSASEAYYSDKGQLQGQWHGDLAAHFGLTGGVTKEAFQRLAEGQDPATGEQLVEHRDTIKTKTGEEVGHRSAWDFTFSAPKSISQTALVGGDERIREAHREAVGVALDYLQTNVQARLGGDHAPKTTRNWAAATFEHDTSRPVDGYPAPQLHTHVVAFNMTADEDGKIRSLQPKELFRLQQTGTAIYRAELAVRLKEFGYELDPRPGNSFEIKGYTQDYLDADSARRAQIKERLAELGLDSFSAGETVAHQTREGKLDLSADQIKTLHLKMAEAYGNQPQQAMAAAAERRGLHVEHPLAADVANQGITHAKERLTERQSVIDRYELIRDALNYGQGSIRFQDVESALAQRTASDRREFVPVDHYRPDAPGARYTTPSILRMETAAIDTVHAGQDRHKPLVNESLTKDQFRDQFADTLNNGQKHLVWNVIHSTDQIVGINGGAGTGKTTSLRPIREFAAAAGYATIGLAPTSGAAKELNDAGIKSGTLQAHLVQSRKPNAPPALYFLDESSLSSTSQIYKFLGGLRPEDRVLLIGDVKQHQSVEAGRIFEELQQAGLKTFRLDTIVRQKDPALKDAVQALSKGEIGSALSQLDQQSRIHQVESRDDRFAAIAKKFAEAPANTLVVSPDNRSRQELNTAIRNELRNVGELAADSSHHVLVSRQEITEADRKHAAAYRIGDVVRYGRQNATVGVEKGDYARVIDIDRERNLVTVERAKDSALVTYNPKQAIGVQLYEQQSRDFAVGERIQFTASLKDRGIHNRQIATITALDTEGNVTASLDKNSRQVSWNLRDNAHVDHGYVLTSYSAQGATVDRVLVQVDTGDTRIRKLLDKSFAYVSVSRARLDAQIFTDSRDGLDRALGAADPKPNALSIDQVRARKVQHEATQEAQQQPKPAQHDRQQQPPAPGFAVA